MAELLALGRRFVRQMAVAARMDLLLVLGSKAQAALWIVTDAVSYVAGIAGVLLLAERFDGVAGWSQAQLAFLVGYQASASGLRGVFFNYNVAAISRRIGRGQLDHTLVQPQPMLLSFLTEGFSPFAGSGALLPGVAALAVGAASADVAVTPGFVARLVVCLLSSTTILLAGSFVIGSIAFWAPRGAEEISTRAGNVLQPSDLPLDPLPSPMRAFLLTVIPAGFVAWFPAGALVGRRPAEQWLLTPLAALVAVAVATVVFRRGLRHYARTGSSRYSTFGHRR